MLFMTISVARVPQKAESQFTCPSDHLGSPALTPSFTEKLLSLSLTSYFSFSPLEEKIEFDFDI